MLPLSLQTSESGSYGLFTVALTSQPIDTVTVAVASSNLAEGVIGSPSLVFTAADWNQPHLVAALGVDDLIADGNQIYTVVLSPAVSNDLVYDGLDPVDVTVTNLDNDSPAFTVKPTAGLVVTERGDDDTFTIVLNTRPVASVTVALTSGNPGEGTVGPISVTFTPLNWNIPRTVTVRGVPDNIADGNVAFTIITGAATSADPAYAGLDPPDVQVISIDSDTPQVYVRAQSLLVVSENGTTATFQIGLTTKPLASVTCTLYSTDLTEGAVSPTNIVFTLTNWGSRPVTVLGLHDPIADGNILFRIVTNACTSTDPAYDRQNPLDVNVLNMDND